MPHFYVCHAVRGRTVESIVLDVPTPRAACERAAEWLEQADPGILAGQVVLAGQIHELTERDAFARVGIPERRAS